MMFGRLTFIVFFFTSHSKQKQGRNLVVWKCLCFGKLCSCSRLHRKNSRNCSDIPKISRELKDILLKWAVNVNFTGAAINKEPACRFINSHRTVNCKFFRDLFLPLDTWSVYCIFSCRCQAWVERCNSSEASKAFTLMGPQAFRNKRICSDHFPFDAFKEPTRKEKGWEIDN